MINEYEKEFGHRLSMINECQKKFGHGLSKINEWQKKKWAWVIHDELISKK